MSRIYGSEQFSRTVTTAALGASRHIKAEGIRELDHSQGFRRETAAEAYFPAHTGFDHHHRRKTGLRLDVLNDRWQTNEYQSEYRRAIVDLPKDPSTRTVVAVPMARARPWNGARQCKTTVVRDGNHSTMLAELPVVLNLKALKF
jgi:hypothetical protein